MNPKSFSALSSTEDLKNFVEEFKKVFDVMHVVGIERIELDAYQLKSMSMTLVRQVEGGQRLECTRSELGFISRSFLESFLSPRAERDQGT